MRLYRIKTTALNIFVLLGLVFGLASLGLVPAQAACAPVANAMGTVHNTVNVASAGTYRLWSRIMPDAANVTNDSYVLEVDGTTCGIIVGNATIPANTWTWLDYQNGTATNKINLTLTAGTHTIDFIGREDGVKLDRVLLLSDQTCVPSGTGDNCGSAQDATPPIATISAPVNGATVSGTATINVSATDNVAVTSLELLVDGTVKNTVSAASMIYALNTTTLTNGSHILVARAHDAAANTSANASITITVANAPPADVTLPTTSITAPTANATMTGLYTLTATAADNIGVAKVEFYVDGVLKSTDTSAPYSYQLDTTSLTNASHVVKVIAYDAANNSVQATVTAIVANTVPPPPVPTKPGDTNGSGTVDRTDLRVVLINYGKTITGIINGDLNADGKVDRADLRIILVNYGK